MGKDIRKEQRRQRSWAEAHACRGMCTRSATCGYGVTCRVCMSLFVACAVLSCVVVNAHVPCSRCMSLDSISFDSASPLPSFTPFSPTDPHYVHAPPTAVTAAVYSDTSLLQVSERETGGEGRKRRLREGSMDMCTTEADGSSGARACRQLCVAGVDVHDIHALHIAGYTTERDHTTEEAAGGRSGA